MSPRYWNRAVGALRVADPVLARVIEGCDDSRPRRRADPFAALARAIVAQQISVAAAANVWARLTALADPFEAMAVARLSADALRGCGLSRQKAAYLLDLAAHFHAGRVDPARWRDLDDEGVIGELTQVKGIGRWTAEIFLMFHLMRPDILPVADVGLQRAVSRLYNRGRPVSEMRLRRIARAWSPWRSVATWYMWRSLDAPPDR